VHRNSAGGSEREDSRANAASGGLGRAIVPFDLDDMYDEGPLCCRDSPGSRRTRGRKGRYSMEHAPGCCCQVSDFPCFQRVRGGGGSGTGRDQGIVEERRDAKGRKFWPTQPMVQLGEELGSKVGPLDRQGNDGGRTNNTASTKPSLPAKVPPEFYFSNLNLDDHNQLHEVYNLLREHYVADKDGQFRFYYSKNMLKWAAFVPGYRPNWFVGLRKRESNELVGCILATPSSLAVNGSIIQMATINFLNLRLDVRSKSLAPVLIQEITRRLNSEGIYQAFFTSGALVAKPLAITRYYHRPLNWQRCLELQFVAQPRNQTVEEVAKMLRLNPMKSKLKFHYRPMTEEDLKQVHELWTGASKRYKLHSVFTEEMLRHLLIPSTEDLVWTYVATPPRDVSKVVGFTSFYALPMRTQAGQRDIRGDAKTEQTPTCPRQLPQLQNRQAVYETSTGRLLDIAHLFYHASDEKRGPGQRELVQAAVHFAQSKKFDVLNSHAALVDPNILVQERFLRGDADLNWYLFNYGMPRQLHGLEIGIVAI